MNALLWILLAGCPSPKDETGDSTSDPGPFVPDLPTGGCGLEPYAWVDDTRLGELVDVEEVSEWTMTADSISLILAMSGVTGFDIPYGTRGWRFRYVTQDRGQEVEATGMMAVPDVDGDWPLLLAPHGTSGFTDACAPSAGDLEDVGFNLLFAALGYAVVAPDYLGMNGMGEPAGYLHPYLVPEPTAVATLDAGRAFLRFQDAEGLTSRADPSRTVLWGGSEGGYAVLWADRYGAGYVPEMQVVATVALVPPTDVTALALLGLTALGDPTAAVAGAWATHHAWYRMAEGLDTVLTDTEPRYVATNLPLEMMASCSDIPSVEGITELSEAFQPQVLEAAAAGDLSTLGNWGCTMAMSDLHATAVPRGSSAPVLLQISGADTLVLPDPVRDSIPVLCDQGYRIEHLECAGASHTDGAVSSIPYQADWIAARLAGEPLVGDCVLNAPVDCSIYLAGEQGD